MSKAPNIVMQTIINGLKEKVLPTVNAEESPDVIIARLLKEFSESISEDEKRELALYGFSFEEAQMLLRHCLIKAVNTVANNGAGRR